MDPKPSSEGHLYCEIGAAGGSGKKPSPILLTAYGGGGGVGRQLAIWASTKQPLWPIRASGHPVTEGYTERAWD